MKRRGRNASLEKTIGVTFVVRATLVFAAAFSAVVSRGAVRGAVSDCRPWGLLAQVRAAEGGDAWGDIAELSAYGRVRTSGLTGAAQIDVDLRDGKSARRFDVAVVGKSARVFDGRATWAQDISGGVRPYDSPFARQAAITDAYLARRGYATHDEPVAASCVGRGTIGASSFTTVRVQPWGGIPADLSVDDDSHLLLAVSEQGSIQPVVTTFGDYRAVGDVVLPFSIRKGSSLGSDDDYEVQVRRYVIQKSAAASDFARPAEPDVVRMLASARTTTVPMLLEGRQLIVLASVNGNAPMPFILDTGGHAILTTQAAQKLGIGSAGAGQSGGSGSGKISVSYARVKSIRIGAAELLDQPMLVIPYPYSFYERGTKEPLAGIIGLEFFERFAARLDYAARTVTFAPLSSFRYGGTGTLLPFSFEPDPDMPMVDASADAADGLFGVDTGNSGSLILFGGFLDRSGLGQRYTGGAAVVGSGTGGHNSGNRHILRQFSIAGHQLGNVVTVFTHMTSGAFSSPTQAGNLGFSILSRFVPTFDYATQTLYLDPEPHPASLLQNRSGIGFEKNRADAFDVLVVAPDSSGAAAGIAPGDRIVRIDGKPASDYSWSDLIALVAARPGTVLQLLVERGENTRTVQLTLR